ncbi:MAG: hypothetical protein KDD58_15895 [Bdellovibrionales bacterium]|nr:hypothetical protein [Bdellovibrionales bacterium]
MKNLKIIITIFLAATLMSACSKDKNSGTTARGGSDVYNPNINCNGCSQVNKLSALGNTGNGIQLILDFFAVTVDGNGKYTPINQNFSGYNGPVSAVGRLYLATSLVCGYQQNGGYAMAGTYDIKVTAVGQMDPQSGGIYNLEAEAFNGSHLIRFKIPQSFPMYFHRPVNNFDLKGCDNKSYSTEMVGSIQIVNINGQSCGNTVAFGGYGSDQNLYCPNGR